MAPHDRYLGLGAFVRQVAIEHLGIDAFAG
jgi:hypothetical protein